MKKFFFALTSLFLAHSALALPHLDLEMTSQEYRRELAKAAKARRLGPDEPAIAAAVQLGERLSKWISVINASRPAASAIRLTSADTRRGIPIDAPSIYSPVTINAKTNEILSKLPEVMKSVLASSADLPTSPGIDDTTFILHARLIDKNYQSAVRYKLVNVYRGQYIQLAANDVRGFYFLVKNSINAEYLSNVAAIDPAKLPVIKEALAKICQNSNESYATCKSKVEGAVQSNTLSALYNKYIVRSQTVWNNFFKIPARGRRSDVKWANNVMVVPFNTPSIPKFVPYLKNNIEDEFRFGDWKLLINFGTFYNGPRLTFQAGVVPHVNGLGGNEIVMDSNQPIEEYESQWTIRHEFGHVLGLPDCYHEFYDTNLQAFVNYQLDITDLMCSRAGNMNERIYKELKQAYGSR